MVCVSPGSVGNSGFCVVRWCGLQQSFVCHQMVWTTWFVCHHVVWTTVWIVCHQAVCPTVIWTTMRFVTRWCGQQCGLHVTRWCGQQCGLCHQVVWPTMWLVSPGGVANNVIYVSPGGMDNSVRLWDLARVMEEQDPETDSNIPSSLNVWVHPVCVCVCGHHSMFMCVCVCVGAYVGTTVHSCVSCVLVLAWALQYVHVCLCWCLCGHHSVFTCVWVLVLVWAPQYVHVCVCACVFGTMDLCAIYMPVRVWASDVRLHFCTYVYLRQLPGSYVKYNFLHLSRIPLFFLPFFLFLKLFNRVFFCFFPETQILLYYLVHTTQNQHQCWVYTSHDETFSLAVGLSFCSHDPPFTALSTCVCVCVRLHFQMIWSQESYMALLVMLEMCRPLLRSQVSSVFHLEFFLSQWLWRWYLLSSFFIRTSSLAQSSMGMMWHFLVSFHSASLSRSCCKKCWMWAQVLALLVMSGC